MASMKKLTITRQQARRFILAHQGLWPPYELEGKSGILEYIRRVGCVQFDPLNIVGHNQELVLQARVADFRPGMLQELLYQDRELLDGWDKNMAIYCTEDWPYFRRNREAARDSLGHGSRPAISVLPQVRKAIEEQGPLSSIDLDLLAPDPNKTEEQYRDWYVLRRIGGIGLLWNKSGDAWLGISGIKSRERHEALARLIRRGKVVEIRVEGIESPFYMRSEDQPFLDQSLELESGGLSSRAAHAAILAPLDNLLWDRRLVKELFDFNYRWEVYKPVAERRYGYYVLPILHGDRFVARFEPGRDKKSGALVIKKWWWEPGVSQSERMRLPLRHGFKQFLSYLGTDRLQIDGETAEQAGLGWL